MKKYGTLFVVGAGILFGLYMQTSAQETAVLTATLHSETSPAKQVGMGAQHVDAARITLTATGSTVYLRGISLATDVSGGLNNFTSLYIYDTEDDSLVGTAPNLSERPYLIQFFDTVDIPAGRSKTYLVQVTISGSAAGVVRVGFDGFTYATLETPSLSGIPIFGNALTLPGATPTPTPTPSSTPTPTPGGFPGLAALGLHEGDTISAEGSSDPDIYIVNDWGFKRLFLNPVIFSFYGHLGGFAGVKNVTPETRDILRTSGLFRNCETNDPKVYGIEVTGEDISVLHWINTTGVQAVQDDPEFFRKVFCINSQEFNWYPKGSDYTSVNQVPVYTR